MIAKRREFTYVDKWNLPTWEQTIATAAAFISSLDKSNVISVSEVLTDAYWRQIVVWYWSES